MFEFSKNKKQTYKIQKMQKFFFVDFVKTFFFKKKRGRFFFQKKKIVQKPKKNEVQNKIFDVQHV